MLEAFEEYWDYTGLGEKVHYVPDAEEPEQFLVKGINRKEERREGWIEALKEAQKQDNIKEWIDKELGE